MFWIRDQRGISPLFLLLMAALAIIAFIIISGTFPFKSNLFLILYPKTQSQAATGCQQLTVQKNQNINNFTSDLYTWYDSNCKVRSAAMASNLVQDPFGSWGGLLNRFTYDLGGSIRTIKSENSGHPGFGAVVNHYESTASVSHWSGPGESYKTAFQGTNHAIHEYKWQLWMGGMVDVTVHWFFASGRDHPIYAITYDSRPAGRNTFWADTRSPYGDLEFDGNSNFTAVDGLGWGDHYKFKTLTSPVTTQTGWDYSQPNTVPYVLEWANSADAEMGLVQTQTWQQQDAGGYWLYGEWGTLHNNGPMPQDWNWPYQLNQYELPFTTGSKRMAWGANYGAVGQDAYAALGDARSLSGYPFQSYSVYMVLDRHTKNPVFTQVAEIENIQKSSLTASVGTVITQGPGGVSRTDNVTYQPAGYNQIYGTWEVNADNSNKAVFTLNTGGTALKSPIFVIRNYKLSTPPQTITVNGITKQVNVDFLPSVDTATSSLWITLPDTFSGNIAVNIGGQSTSTPTPSPTSQPTSTPTASPTPTPTPQPTKLGDINGDNQVGILDFAILLSKWNTNDTASDLNDDGLVGILDFAILLSKWGT